MNQRERTFSSQITPWIAGFAALATLVSIAAVSPPAQAESRDLPEQSAEEEFVATQFNRIRPDLRAVRGMEKGNRRTWHRAYPGHDGDARGRRIFPPRAGGTTCTQRCPVLSTLMNVDRGNRYSGCLCDTSGSG